MVSALPASHEPEYPPVAAADNDPPIDQSEISIVSTNQISVLSQPIRDQFGINQSEELTSLLNSASSKAMDRTLRNP